MRSLTRVLATGVAVGAALVGATATATAEPSRPRPDYTSVGSTLTTGQSLTGGHCLTNDRQASLTFCVVAATGDLVLDAHLGVPSPPTQLWSALGTPGDRLVPQRDGNLVLYSATGKAIWSSGTGGHTAADLVLQADANVVLSDSAGPLWSTGTGGLVGMSIAHPTSTLKAGQYLASGSGIVGGAPGYGAVYLYRGQLQILPVVKDWTNHVAPDFPFAIVRMQGGGNLVESNGGKVLWSTHTGGNPGARLVMQRDGNAVIYSASGKALWASGT